MRDKAMHIQNSASTKTIYVSPEGSDQWSGTRPSPSEQEEDGPVCSLHRARELAREALSDGLNVQVQLRGGLYRPDEPLVLGPRDSGTADKSALWRNYPDERPVISASRPIEGWTRLAESPEEPPEGLSEEALDNVWVTELPEIDGAPWDFSVLFDDEGRLPRARTERMEAPEPPEEKSRTRLHFPRGAMRQWGHLDDVEVFLIPTHPFTANYLPLAEVDLENCVAHTALPGTYALQGGGAFFRVENVPEGMREPGHWMLDTSCGRLYLWPRGEHPREDGVSAPVHRELLRIEGNFEEKNWVRHIRIRGLTFQHGDRMRFRKKRQSLQHDWEQHDEPNAMIRIRGAENVTVEQCRLSDAGSAGLRMDLHARSNCVLHNKFTRLGGTGIVLAGFGPGTRDEHRRNEVGYNHIHHVAELWWQSCGIFITQSGENHIHDNLLHNLPYIGIVISGMRSHIFEQNDEEVGTEGARTIRRDEVQDVPRKMQHLVGYLHARRNMIEHNEVREVMERLGDGNGIYLSGTGVGNVVRRNYVHHITGKGAQSALRTDGWQWHSLFEENVVWKCDTGGLTVKQVNQYDNNIFADCTACGCVMVRQSPNAQVHGSGVRRNILYQSTDDIERPGRYAPFYEDSHRDRGWNIDQVGVNDNLLWCDSNPEAARKVIKQMQENGNNDTRSVVADPMFVDPDNGDFRLEADSPALQVGFRPIDEWGPRGETGP